MELLYALGGVHPVFFLKCSQSCSLVFESRESDVSYRLKLLTTVFAAKPEVGRDRTGQGGAENEPGKGEPLH